MRGCFRDQESRWASAQHVISDHCARADAPHPIFPPRESATTHPPAMSKPSVCAVQQRLNPEASVLGRVLLPNAHCSVANADWQRGYTMPTPKCARAQTRVAAKVCNGVCTPKYPRFRAGISDSSFAQIPPPISWHAESDACGGQHAVLGCAPSGLDLGDWGSRP